MKNCQNQKLIESVGLVGQSDAMAKVAELITINRTRAVNTLILGEDGCETGMVAEAMCRIADDTCPTYANRINCGLFAGEASFEHFFWIILGREGRQHEPSAGLLEKSEGGTIIFEDVHELSRNSQHALMQVLATKSYARLGSNCARSIDHLRVIVTANPSPNQFKLQGQLDASFQRSWDGAAVYIPPLRERLEDLPLLLEYFMKQQPGSVKPTFSEDAVTHLKQRKWIFNVTEVETTVKMVLFDFPSHQVVTARDLKSKGLQGQYDLNT